MSRRYGIRTYVTCLTLLPLLVVAVLIEAALLRERMVNMEQSQRERGELLARQLAAGSEYGIFFDNRELLHQMASHVSQEADVLAVRISNQDGMPLAAVGDAGMALADSEVMAVRDEGRMLVFHQPVYPAQVALDEPPREQAAKPVGTVMLALGWERIRMEQRRLLWQVSAATFVMLLLVAYLIRRASRRLTDPIQRLNSVIHAIGRGELFSRVRQEACIRELHAFGEGVNEMAARLQREHATLQQRIDEATEQLRMLAFYDTLTGLPNRRLLSDRLQQVIAASRRSGHYAAVMFLDLDNFKPVNDEYGHGVGDLLLIEAGGRIESCLRGMDTVARFGGDEFVVLLNELDVDRATSTRQAQVVAEKIRTALSDPYLLSSQTEGRPPVNVRHICTASIGVVLFQGQGADPEQILAQADDAMYQAKASGDAICFLNEPAD